MVVRVTEEGSDALRRKEAVRPKALSYRLHIAERWPANLLCPYQRVDFTSARQPRSGKGCASTRRFPDKSICSTQPWRISDLQSEPTKT